MITYVQIFDLHLSRVVLPTAVDLPEAPSADDSVNTEVIEGDCLGQTKLHVLPLTEPNKMIAVRMTRQGKKHIIF